MNEEKLQQTEAEAAVTEKAKGFLSQAFEFFTDHFQRLGEEFRKHNEMRQQVQERINRGAKRTDGPAV